MTPEVICADHNLYFCPGLESPRMRVRGIASYADWQAKGFDRNSLFDDTLFRNPAEDDYSLRPDSPAFDLGFEAID